MSKSGQLAAILSAVIMCFIPIMREDGTGFKREGIFYKNLEQELKLHVGRMQGLNP